EEEEGKADRDLERRPDVVGELEAVEAHRARPGRPQVALAGAHGDARLARAQDPPLADVEQVAMILGHRGATDVAARALVARWRRRRRLRHPPQARDELGVRGTLRHASATFTSAPVARRSSGTGSSWPGSAPSARPARRRS